MIINAYYIDKCRRKAHYLIWRVTEKVICPRETCLRSRKPITLEIDYIIYTQDGGKNDRPDDIAPRYSISFFPLAVNMYLDKAKLSHTEIKFKSTKIRLNRWLNDGF